MSLERNYVYDLIHLMVYYYGSAMHLLIKKLNDESSFSLEQAIKAEKDDLLTNPNTPTIFSNIDAVKNCQDKLDIEEVIKEMDVQACSKLLCHKWINVDDEAGLAKIRLALPNTKKEDIRKLRESIMHLINDRNALMGHINEYTHVSYNEFEERLNDIKRIFRIIHLEEIDKQLKDDFSDFYDEALGKKHFDMSFAILQDMKLAGIPASKYTQICKEVIGEIAENREGNIATQNYVLLNEQKSEEITQIINYVVRRNKQQILKQRLGIIFGGLSAILVIVGLIVL